MGANILKDFFSGLADIIRLKTVYTGGEDDTMIPEQMSNIIKERILSEHNGKFIESIHCYTPKGILGIKSVTFGPFVETVFANSYAKTENLTTVKFLGDVKTIENSAFDGCISLTDIDLSTVTNIGEYAFMNCSKLVNIIFSDSLIHTGQQALNTTGWFKAAEGARVAGRVLCGVNGSTEEIEILDKVLTSIPAGAFNNNTTLKKINIRINGIADMQCFQNCKGLEVVRLQQNEDETVFLDIRAFFKCVNLQEFYADNLNIVGSQIFDECKNLKKIGIGSISDLIQKFLPSSLEELQIGNVNKVHENAFENCKSLTQIYIQNEDAIPTGILAAFNKLASYKTAMETGEGSVTLHVSSELITEWEALIGDPNSGLLSEDYFNITIG